MITKYRLKSPHSPLKSPNRGHLILLPMALILLVVVVAIAANLSGSREVAASARFTPEEGSIRMETVESPSLFQFGGGGSDSLTTATIDFDEQPKSAEMDGFEIAQVDRAEPVPSLDNDDERRPLAPDAVLDRQFRRGAPFRPDTPSRRQERWNPPSQQAVPTPQPSPGATGQQYAWRPRDLWQDHVPHGYAQHLPQGYGASQWHGQLPFQHGSRWCEPFELMIPLGRNDCGYRDAPLRGVGRLLQDLNCNQPLNLSVGDCNDLQLGRNGISIANRRFNFRIRFR